MLYRIIRRILLSIVHVSNVRLYGQCTRHAVHPRARGSVDSGAWCSREGGRGGSVARACDADAWLGHASPSVRLGSAPSLVVGKAAWQLRPAHLRIKRDRKGATRHSSGSTACCESATAPRSGSATAVAAKARGSTRRAGSRHGLQRYWRRIRRRRLQDSCALQLPRALLS